MGGGLLEGGGGERGACWVVGNPPPSHWCGMAPKWPRYLWTYSLHKGKCPPTVMSNRPPNLGLACSPLSGIDSERPTYPPVTQVPRLPATYPRPKLVEELPTARAHQHPCGLLVCAPSLTPELGGARDLDVRIRDRTAREAASLHLLQPPDCECLPS
jgi:hypothetical protein